MKLLDYETLLWCLQPKLDLLDYWPKGKSGLPKLARIARPWQRLHFKQFGPFLVAATTYNQSRTLEPVFAGQVGSTVIFDTTVSWLQGGLSWQSSVREAVAWGEHILKTRERFDALHSWRNQVALTAFHLTSFLKTDLSRYDCVVVATQHEPVLRALMVAAQRQGVPVLYVPHAPVADNPRYSDLPVAFAALRGKGEVDHYVEQYGVLSSLIDIVGNPATDVLTSDIPVIDREFPGVLALSPEPEPNLRRIFDLVEAASVDKLVVAAHPRSDRDLILRLLRSSWTLCDAPTLEVLRAGPPYVIQHSSGVAWESAALGLPTANICLDDETPAYPFLRKSSVFPPLASSDDIRFFVSGAQEADRELIRGHAVEWCALDGEEAAVRVRRILSTIADGSRQPSVQRILDGWAGPSGASVQQTWLPTR